jgi:hypothetical protein
MKAFEASGSISASADIVWQLLTDADGYTSWDPDVTKVDGTIAAGEKITVYTKISPDRAFPVTVSTFEPGKKMVWSSGMPLGMFKGARTFTLTEQVDGSTDYHVREEFTGWMLPFIGRTIPDLSEAFQRHVDGLKAAAEASR